MLLFRLLLHLLPPEIRRRMGREVTTAVRRRLEERRTREGRWAAARYLAREIGDLAGNVVGTWATRLVLRVETHRGGGIDGWIADLKLAFRGLRRSSRLALGAVLTLGVAIGATLALTSLVWEVVLRPLPYEDPGELAAVWTPWAGGSQELGVAWSDLGTLHREVSSVEAVAGALLPGMDDRMLLETETGHEEVEGVRVTPNFFTVLGVAPVLGPGVPATSPFDEGEPSVVLSRIAWERRFGSDPGVIGQTLRLQGRAHTVAGVLPDDFEFRLGQAPPEMYALRAPGSREREDGGSLGVLPVARLAPGADVDALGAELARLTSELDMRRSREIQGLVLQARPLEEHLIGALGRPMGALAVAAFLVLLVACTNLGTLFMARHSERADEQAVRAALGGSRIRLARLPILEAVFLGVAGGLVGLWVAVLATDAVLGQIPHPPFRYDGFELGPGAVAATLGVSVLSGLLFGGLPAWRAARTSPAGALRTGRGCRARSRAPRILAGVEAALLVVLLVATGLSLRSLEALLAVDPGFQAEGRAAATLIIPEDRTGTLDEFGRFLVEVEERIQALPGVQAAGTVTHLPLDPNSWGGSLVVEGREEAEALATEWELASPGYFRAAGIALLQGRAFLPDDGPSAPSVTIVSRRLAESMGPGGDVLGMRISGTGPAGPWMEVVGVVEDVRQRDLAGELRPHIYVAHAQMFAFPERILVVHAPQDPMGALRGAEELLRAMDPDLAVVGAHPLPDLVRRASVTPRVVAALLTLMGGASLLLALTGVYGVTAYALERRRRELGIRVCLGAGRGELVARGLGEALVPVMAGVAVGLGAVILLAPRADGLLHGVDPLDPLTLTTVPLLLLAAATLTALRPVRRAARASPLDVIREE